MRYILFLMLFLPAMVFAQSETNDFITYDTTYRANSNSATPTFTWRISRPANMFTPNHPDTASRPVIITMPGAGEVGTNPAFLSAYGPHYWKNQGWDGSVKLANGTHYPIIITLLTDAQNVRPQYVLNVLQYMISHYHIKKGSVHLGGLSMGGFTWGRLIAYAASVGDKTAMSLIKSYVCLQGAAADNFNGISWGVPGFGIWAHEFDGRFFGLEGYADTREVWKLRNGMRDTLAAYGLPNTKGYFSFETLNSGKHGGWNEMYDPNQHDWRSIPTITSPNITTNNNTGKDNSIGSYLNGSSIFEWMLRQGDTSLVNGAPGAALANAGPDQNLSTAVTSTTLTSSASSGTIISRLWTLYNTSTAPNTPTITTPNGTTTSVTGLIQGTYEFQLRVANATDTSYDRVLVTLTSPSNIAPTVSAGPDKSLNSPLDSTRVTATASDADGTIASYSWTSVSGSGAIIRTPNAATTDVVNLPDGITTLRITVTDNSGAIKADDINITVVDQSVVLVKRVNIAFGPIGVTTLPAWNAFVMTNAGTNFTSGQLKNDDGTMSTNYFNITNSNTTADNGAGWVTTGDFEKTVGRYTTSSTLNRVFTLYGCDDNQNYRVKVLASRSNSSAATTDFIIGGSTVNIATDGNLNKIATFPGVRSVGGVITMNINLKAGANNRLNGIIIEGDDAGPLNVAPVVLLGADQTISSSPGSITITPTISDEGGTLVYLWTQIAGTTAIISPTNTAQGNFSGMTTAGTRSFRLAVTDTGGLVGIDTINIVVNPANNIPPVPAAGSDQSFSLPKDSVILTGSGSSDPDGTIATYLWTKQSGPTGGSFTSTNTANVRFVRMPAGTYVFRLTITDNSGATTFDEVVVSVSEAIPSLTRVMPQASSGEYQSYYIDKFGLPWATGNLTNIGTGNTGVNGVVQRVVTSPTNLKFKSLTGGLHSGALVDTAGYVWVAGDNTNYEHGTGTTAATFNCTRIDTDSSGNVFNNIVQVSSTYIKNKGIAYLAIKDSAGTRTLWVWGVAVAGIRGNGTDSLATDTCKRPVQIFLPEGKIPKKIVAGTMAMLQCMDGTVATWGQTNAANLGYAATGKDYQTPHFLPNISDAKDISGGGLFNIILSADGTLRGFGSYGNYMGNANGLPLATPTVLTNIMNGLPAGEKVASVYANTVCSHVLSETGRLYGFGNNAQGTIGNGQQLAHPNPYAWDFGRDGLIQLLPVEIAPGVKFISVSFGNTYTFCTVAVAVDSSIYCWGKNKANVLPVRIVSPTSAMTSERGNSWDRPWPTLVEQFGSTGNTVYVSTSPICITTPGTSPCSGYTVPANVKPTANAGSTHNLLSKTRDTLNASGSTDNVHISYYEWSQVSGPNQAVLSLPGNSICPIAGLMTGVYQFKVVTTDNGWFKDSAMVTVNVNQAGNQIPVVTFTKAADTIQLTQNSANLTGFASDPDGTIASYKWTKESGPSGGDIQNDQAATTTITNITLPGIYVYKLEATDNLGGKGSANITITVQAKPATGRNQYPTFIIRVGKIQPL